MLPPLTVALLLGLIFGSFLPYVPGTILLLSILTAVLLASFERCRSHTPREGRLLYGALLGGVLLWTIAAAPADHPDTLSLVSQERTLVTGTVVEPVRQSPTRSVIVVSADRIGDGASGQTIQARIRLTWRTPDQTFRLGDRITWTSRLRAPTGTHNPGGFDYATYLRRQGIHATASVSGPGRVSLIQSGGSRARWVVWNVIDAWRDEVRRAAVASLEGSALGIYLGLIIGERGFLAPELRDEFMATGTVHILSISGSHLGLIALLSFFLVRQACLRLPARWLLALSRRTTPSRLAAILTIPPLVFYSLLAGAEIATVRSLVMTLVCLLAVWLGHPKQMLHALAVAAWLILLHDPRALFDISFQLSFMSVLALALVLRWRGSFDSEAPGTTTPTKDRAMRWLSDYLWISAAVTLATLPLVAYYFNQVAWLGLLANLLVVPFAGFCIVPLGLFSALVLLVGGGETLPFGPLNQGALDFMSSTVGWLGRIPGAEWHVASPMIPAIMTFYVCLVVACRASMKPSCRRLAAWGVALLVLWWMWSPRPMGQGDTVRVTFLDVGQGDASVIELPGGDTILIDAGAAYDRLDMGRSVVGPFLWDRGIRHLDLVIGTHPQLDHIGGLPWVIQKFEVGEYWGTGIAREQTFYKRLQQGIQARGLMERHPIAGQVLLRSDPCRLIALNPPASHSTQGQPVGPRSSGSRLNNLSVVTRLVCGPHSFLFTADIESKSMARLGRDRSLIRARVIKVPHHGGLSSWRAGWPRRVGAEAAVISVGRRNPYRHPAQAVLASYDAAGTSVWRTDRDGAVTVEGKMSSDAMTISTARGAIPQPLSVLRYSWRSEIRNLRLIWNQWVGP